MQRGSRIISAVLVGMILASFLVLTPTGVAAAGAPYYVGTLADDDGTNTANCGSPTNTDCSLRSALAAATSGSDWIMFRSGLSGTITLTHGTLILEQSVMISGPGADVITVSGNNEVGVFQLGVEYFSSAPPAFSFTGFTIANGNGQLGGAMYIQMVSSVTIFKMAFTNNTARDSGGAIYNRWKGTETRFLVIKDSTFNGNASLSWWSINPDESAPGGGAIFNGAYQTLSISNSTFVDNHADGKYQVGGAILTHGPTSIVNSTITGNSSFNSGGGIRNSFGTSSSEMFTKLTNTIVAGNTVTISDQTGRDITGQYTGDNNLIGAIHQAGRLAGSNNLIGMNPALGTLGYYGGTTQTVPLLPGSPAIATGVYRDTFPQVDQRGLAREGHVDMGAFQARDFSITMIAGDQQSTTAGTDFSEPFVVSVASPHGEPVAGGLVTFSGPATGAGIQGSPLAVIGADGRAEQMLTANNAVGAYEVQANIGAAGAVSYSLENTDSTPPVTTASAKKADKSIYVSGAWTSQAVTVTLSSTDLETEVAQILYSIDGGAPQTYQNPVTISSNGAHTFTYWSIDTAGNVEASQSLSINIDTTFVLETTLLEHPPAVSSSRRVQFSFSGSGTYPIARFQCTLDVAGFETFKTCSSPFDLANVPGGVHTFQVRAVDTDGNIDATPATYTWTIDPVPPDTALLSTPPSPSDSSSASFTFSGSDNLEVAGFQCALDGADFSACASPLTLSGLGGGSHTLQVRAVDTAGTADPTPASYTWTVDIGPPETTLLTTPASISNVTSAAFTFSGSDGGGIARFECSLDGAAFATCSSPVYLTGLSNGAHSFEVRAVDTSGEIDPTPERYTWTIDSVAPETTLLTQPAAITNSAAASFTFSGSDASSLTFECKLDSAAFAPCSSSAQYSGLSAGAHTFQVRATDAAGNVDATPASFSWTIDTTAPETTISGAPSAVSASNAATFTFTG
ncbi:MAG: hypothetical protein DCC58_09835, partial [Chloroflexi bacterium]